MRDAEKNRDPERAKKRARNDARCALRKLEMMPVLEWLGEKGNAWREKNPHAALDFVTSLLEALGEEVKP